MKRSNFKHIVSSLNTNGLDITERSIPILNGLISIFYIKQLTDRAGLIENLVKPLVLHCSTNKLPFSAQMAIDGIIFADDCWIDSDTNKIKEYILTGMAVVLFTNDKDYIVANFKKVEHRPIPTPQLTYTVRGPQDCFNENIDVNLSLLRYRLKDKNLHIKKFEVGVRSQAAVAVIYIEDIANDKVVTEIQNRIEKINVAGIGESGELQSLLLNSKMQLFPNIGIVERSDMAFHSLIEGKVLVLVDGSGIGLLAPKVFWEFFYSCDDRYDNKFFGVFSRLLRYIAFIIAFTSTSVFVAISAFHTDVLPSEYAIYFATMRQGVPFSSLLGALIIEFIVELLREALLRVPKQIGPAVGIVGAIVIGQASIAAGFFSPLLLIIVAISLLSSFAMPDYTLITPFRILKLILILFTGALGFFGFTLFITIVIAELVSINSFGVPYFAPITPFNLYDTIRVFIQNITINPKRPKYLDTKDKTYRDEF